MESQKHFHVNLWKILFQAYQYDCNPSQLIRVLIKF